MDKRWITIKEAAAYSHIGTRRLIEMARQGIIWKNPARLLIFKTLWTSGIGPIREPRLRILIAHRKRDDGQSQLRPWDPAPISS